MPPQPRERPIPLEVWTQRREQVVRLYRDEKRTAKDVAEVMEKDHGFRVSVRQLKHQFQQWGVGKHINDSDMKIIVSLKRKSQDEGTDINVYYRDQHVPDKKIRRASKRYTDMITDPILPCYIRIEPSSLDERNMNATQAPDVHTTIQELDEASRGVYHDGGMQYTNTRIHYEPSVDGVWDPIPTASADPVQHHFYPYGDSLPDGAGSFPRNHEYPMAWSENLNSFEDFGYDDQTSRPIEREDLAERSQKPDVGTPTFFSEFLTTPPTTSPPDSYSEEVPQQSPYQIDSLLQRTSKEREYQEAMIRTQFVFLGIDAGRIVEPLNSLTAHYRTLLRDLPSRDDQYNYSPLIDLLRLADRKWLGYQVHQLLRGFNQEYARQEQRARDAGTFPGSSDSMVTTSATDTAQDVGLDVQPECSAKVTDYFTSIAPTGTLKIRLKTLSGQSTTSQDEERPHLLDLSFMPNDEMRTTGVSITFAEPTLTAFGYCISPRIRPFSVVPRDSDIIRYVMNNDLAGVQTLFRENLASPVDVDPRGYSLISYSIYGGCSEVLRLLLEGKAGTNNVQSCGNELDMIWAIWQLFVEHNSGRSSPNFPIAINKFEECTKMSQLALDHGCIIDETICCHSSLASPLFGMADYWRLENADAMTPANVLGFLLDIGYNIERRNEAGQTPLLHTATAYQPQVIKCLKLFLNRKADIHSTDHEGRGALHLAMASPDMLESWQQLRPQRSKDNGPSNGDWTLRDYYDTEDEKHAEDFREISKSTSSDNAQILEQTFRQNREISQVPMHTSPVHGSGIASTNQCTSSCMSPSLHEFNQRSRDNIARIDVSDGAGNVHQILDPRSVLRIRLKSKLLTLLQAGCDPNLLDEDDVSPGDYAEQAGLGLEWKWALSRAGSVHTSRR